MSLEDDDLKSFSDELARGQRSKSGSKSECSNDETPQVPVINAMTVLSASTGRNQKRPEKVDVHTDRNVMPIHTEPEGQQ